METWKDVVGYEGLYQISSTGKIKSVKFNRDKSVRPNRDGYMEVRLCKNNHAKTMAVSRLVLTAFVSDPFPNAEAMHLDHDRTNNSVSNLAWGTRQQNEDQKTESGRRSKWSKLTEEDIQTIKRLRESGLTLKEIAAIVPTHFTNISLILRGKTWR